MTSEWIEIGTQLLPQPILAVYLQRGTGIQRVWCRMVRCGWDGVMRSQYRVISSTGRKVQWTPTSRALTSWDPKIVK